MFLTQNINKVNRRRCWQSQITLCSFTRGHHWLHHQQAEKIKETKWRPVDLCSSYEFYSGRRCITL